MDNRVDNFAGGFVAGAFFGSIVGAVLGTLLTSRLAEEAKEPLLEGSPTEGRPRRSRRRQLRAATELNIEEARQSLETKIAQLNTAIDDVRQQLSNVNGNAQE